MRVRRVADRVRVWVVRVELLWLRAWVRVAVSAGVRHVLRDVPDEGGEFASDGDADLALVHATGVQTPVATAEAQLCAPGEVGDGLELILVAHNVGEGHACGGDSSRPTRSARAARGR